MCFPRGRNEDLVHKNKVDDASALRLKSLELHERRVWCKNDESKLQTGVEHRDVTEAVPR